MRSIFHEMSLRTSAAVVAVVTAVTSGCGGTVEGGPTAASGAGAGAGAGGGPVLVMDAGPGTGGGTFEPDSASPDAPYRDPTCPPAGKVQGVHECDVGASLVGCGPGERCVPYVTYGDRCRTEEVGTRCTLAGVGVQGDDCAMAECADGYVCVTGGSGFECARLCTITGGKSDCPPGLLCAPLDVDGYSVCG